MRASTPTVLRTLFLAGALLGTAVPAVAQATSEEAARLQAIGEAYFGKSAAGEAPAVTVVPEADHYRASLDIGVLIRRLIALVPDEDVKKFTLDWPASSMALAPRADGTWRFWDYRIPKLVAEADGQRTELVTEGIDFETITDPKTGVTPSMKGRFGRIAATSTVKKADDPLTVLSENVSSDVTLEGSARATGEPGVVDAVVHQKTGSMLYALAMSGAVAKGIPDMRFTLDGGRQDTAIGVRGLRHTALLDLWAHLVAHHDKEDFTTGQAALKAKLSAALPIFEAVTQKVAGVDFSFTSPFGIAKAEKAAIDLDIAGLVRDGRFSMAIGFTGFQAYSLFMPKWAQKMIPTDMALAVRASGYDLASPLVAFLESADFSTEKPLTPEQEARIGALFLPKGAVEIAFPGNRIVGPLYDVALDGALKASPEGARGTVTVRAKGIDKVAEHLAGPTADEQAKAVGAIVAMARQYAERQGDDLVWRCDFDGEEITINGKKLK